MKQFKGYERKEQVDYLLPKGAYVIKLLRIKEEPAKNGGSYLKIGFDIAEGEHAGFYQKAFDNSNSSNEDKKWSNDAIIYLSCPDDNSPQWIVDNFNKFMTAVEDSNKDYHWNWDESTLKDKLVGAKFCIEQSEYDGKIYDHTKAKWFIAAQKIRDGKYGQLPNDKLIKSTSSSSSSPANEGFKTVDESEIPF